MNNWLRKTLFVLVSVLTFGLVTPTQLINTVNGENLADRDAFEAPSTESHYGQTNMFIEESDFDKEKFIEELIKQAEFQSYQKFGPRIKPVIENEFREIILPNIETALEEIAV